MCAVALLLLGCVQAPSKATATPTVAATPLEIEITAPTPAAVEAVATPSPAATAVAQENGITWSLLACEGCREKGGPNFTAANSPVLKAALTNHEAQAIENVYYGAHCTRRDRNEPISAPFKGDWGKKNPGAGDFEIGLLAADGSLQKTFVLKLAGKQTIVVQMQGFAVPEAQKRYQDIYYDCYLLAQNFADDAVKIRAHQTFFAINFSAQGN